MTKLVRYTDLVRCLSADYGEWRWRVIRVGKRGKELRWALVSTDKYGVQHTTGVWCSGPVLSDAARIIERLNPDVINQLGDLSWARFEVEDRVEAMDFLARRLLRGARARADESDIESCNSLRSLLKLVAEAVSTRTDLRDHPLDKRLAEIEARAREESRS